MKSEFAMGGIEMETEERLSKPRALLSEVTFVPIDYFLNVIEEKTGWDKEEFLKKRDIGNVEKKVHITAKKPNNLNEIPLKRGKSRSQLYSFIGIENRQCDRALVTTLIRSR